MAERDGQVAELFARHVTGLRYEDLPEAAVAAAKIFILDTLGVGVAGATADGTDALLSATREWGSGEQAAIWGRASRVPAGTAALINGFQVHCQEFDCLHERAVLHVMATLLPAAIAHAERVGGVPGRELIVAVVGGIDVAVTIGLAAKSGLRFFRPATAGGFGAVAAVGRLAGFDWPTLTNAFGIQYAQTSGTMQPHLEASVVLPMQVGFNARAAVQSCDLAASGITGPREVFEGRFGYLPLFEGDYDLDPVLAQLGRVWRVTELSHKPWPAGRATHGGIEGILSLRDAHGFAAADVAAVRVIGPPLINRLCGRPDIAAPNANYARLCIAFTAANALLHGCVDPAQFRGNALTDPAVHAVASRIVAAEDATTDPNALAPQEVTVSLTDGTEHRWRGETLLGNPRHPLTREQHLAKFRRCWELAASPAGTSAGESLIALVDRLETVIDLRALTALLTAS
ncbi:MAG: MmgE/PrpD family protein [Acetobacteraceae bacterium]